MKKIFLLVFASFILFSCEDALLEKPKSLAVETFYNTPAEVESALAAIYQPLHESNSMSSLYPAQLVSYSDFFFGRGSYAVPNTYQGLDGTNVTRAGQMWDYFYLSIRNANIVIKNAPDGAELTEADIAKYVGEAKFMRAFLYFTMVKNWGGVPIRTEDNMIEMEIPRNTADEVYQLIFEDLAYAEANLPDVAPLPGKPSRWSAKTLLADVYFYLGRNSEARDKAVEVIQANKFALVPVATADEFDKIFGPEVVTTSEEIFYLKFSGQGLQGFGLPLFAAHPGANMHGFGGYYAFYTDKVDNQLVKNWDNSDLRYGLWYNYDIGLGPNTMLCKKFSDPAAAAQLGAGNDYPLYRYADLLLLFAEADCRVSGAISADALEALNKVHRRAYGKNPLQASEVDFKASDYTKDTFIELVILERGYETICEGKRWHDLKRTGEIKDRIKATTGKDVADKHLLWPIPVSELNYNSAIDPTTDQNPGY